MKSDKSVFPITKLGFMHISRGTINYIFFVIKIDKLAVSFDNSNQVCSDKFLVLQS